MFVHGTEGSAVQYSPCCHPLPGDAIVGHLRGGHGLVLHRADCVNAQRQRTKDAERWVDVQWAENAGGTFRCSIDLTVTDDRGVLGKVAAAISASDANIVHVAMDEEAQQVAQLRFTLQVRDRTHLANVIRNVRRLPEVTRVTRV
jgi:GTP pyrophosphokinase